MDKIVSKGTASPSTYSHDGILKSPPQNARTSLAQNGSALPLHILVTPSNSLKPRDGQHLVDPDEIFARHTVNEVKSIMHKLRSDVDAKQEELRLMVGERYRDLLEASTSIISMSKSSKRVIHTVARMKRIVSTDLGEENLARGVDNRSEMEDTQLKIYQSLAVHIKFLVDAPEHLWRLLEGKQTQHAAWLFMLSRVVHRSLMDEDSEEGRDWVRQGILIKEQFPLVQRQWESISQFRAQISHKATLSLRDQDLKPQDLCASMFTLHLLDSLPLSDALDVFLKQRTRSLQNLYENIKESWGTDGDPSMRHARRSGTDTTKSVWDVLRSILTTIVGTVGNARAVFGETVDGSPSMITQVLSSTQTDSLQPGTPLPPELRLSSHSLVCSLPNSSHFQALPMDIRSYRPFIDLDSQSSRVRQETLNSKLRTWFTKATEHLHESSRSWLTHLETIKKVWELRSSATDWLSTSSVLLEAKDVEELLLLVDDVCRTRVQDIWGTMLRRILRSFREMLQSTVTSIIEEREDSYFDIAPAEYLLSAPPSLSVTQASLNVPLAQSSFQRFRRDVQQRIDGVTPLIGKIMSNAESSALSLRDDMDHAISGDKRSLEVLYLSDSGKAASDLLDTVQQFFTVDDNNPVHEIKRLYFLGRLSQKLTLSPLSSHLRCSPAFSDICHKRARQIYDSCVDKCASAVALSARDKLIRNPTSNVQTIRQNSTLPSSPSPEMMDSLLSLVELVENFAQFKDDAHRSDIARILLSRFLHAVKESLRESTNRDGLQLVWNLYFLKAICDDWGEKLSETAALLDQEIEDSYQSLSSNVQSSYPDLEESLRRGATQSVRYLRLLLSPLVAPSDPSSSMRSPKSLTLGVNRQKTYGVSVGGEREMQPIVDLVKPTARFGLLWVASAAVQ